MDELEDDVGREDGAPLGLEDDVADEPVALHKRKAALLVRHAVKFMLYVGHALPRWATHGNAFGAGIVHSRPGPCLLRTALLGPQRSRPARERPGKRAAVTVCTCRAVRGSALIM